FLTEGNARADALVSAYSVNPVPNLWEQARLSHSFFHQSSRALSRQFGLSREAARNLIAACPDCAQMPNLQAQVVNPRSLLPLQLWQTDVTEFPSFGRLRYIHVSVDTCSLFWATLR
ncbi:PO113 protein, partial [Pterocles burchelli]|nr:PO113 protein [Pterocles burchelli]